MEFFFGFLFALVLLLLSIGIKIPEKYFIYQKVKFIFDNCVATSVSGSGSQLDHCPRREEKNVNRKEVEYFEIKCTILISCCERLGDEGKRKTALKEKKFPDKKSKRERRKKK